jgi:pimeloyl-ACP methyl ester carboxylesterase/class 3 adenylate cyclase
VSIAYQVTGDGPLDIVVNGGTGVPIDLMWEDPTFRHVAKRLRSFSRTVWWEGRGMGASGGNLLDQVYGAFGEGSNEGDTTALLDATASEPVVLVGVSNGATYCLRYAARHPERIRSLVLIGGYAHYVRGPDCPWGFPQKFLDLFAGPAKEMWGTGAWLDLVAPSKSGDPVFREWWARCERLGIGPDEVAIITRQAWEQDVRPLLPSITMPTLVLHREGDRYIRVDAGRYLAEHIPGAKYVELPGEDHFYFTGDVDALVDEIEEFLTGSHQAPEGDLITTTILFTDIVSSTEQSARFGHRKWSALTDAHDAMVRAVLRRHRGREIKTIGDGFLATFDASTRAVHAATEVLSTAEAMGLALRAGIHTGDVEARADDVVGLAVTIAKRICDLAGPGQLLVSEGVKGQLVGSGLAAIEAGTHVLKGVPDEWRLFDVRT